MDDNPYRDEMHARRDAEIREHNQPDKWTHRAIGAVGMILIGPIVGASTDPVWIDAIGVVWGGGWSMFALYAMARAWKSS